MITASVPELRRELADYPPEELMALTLRLARFKKENKELLSYLLFDAHNEDGYVDKVKADIDEQFAEINTSSYYFIKKSVRKILKGVKKHIRFSQSKETEVALLIHFCRNLKQLRPRYTGNQVLINTFNNQIRLAKTTMGKLHEDLQYDYQLELDELLQ